MNNYSQKTTNYILLEAIVILKNRIGIEAVRLFNDDITPVLKVHWIDGDTHNLNIRQAFTFDSHFIDIGFKVLRA